MPKINNPDLHKKIERFSDIRVIGLIAFGIVVLLVSWSILNVLEVNYQLEKERADVKQKNQIQKLQDDNLKLQNVYLQSNEYLELSARRQLNRALPGEKLYLIPRSVAMANTVNLPKTKHQIEQEKKSRQSKYARNIEAWKTFFFHRP